VAGNRHANGVLFFTAVGGFALAVTLGVVVSMLTVSERTGSVLVARSVLQKVTVCGPTVEMVNGSRVGLCGAAVNSVKAIGHARQTVRCRQRD
jgi:hypothetical protein